MGWEQGGSRIKGMESVIITVEFRGIVSFFLFLLDSLLVFLLSLLFVLFVLDLSFSFSSVGASTRLKRASPKRRTQIFKLKYKITSYCARCFSPILCQRNAFHVFYEDLWRCVWVLLRTLHDACEFWCEPLTFCWGPLTMRWIFAQDLSRFAEDLWRCQWLLLRTFHDASEFCWRPFTMLVSFA